MFGVRLPLLRPSFLLQAHLFENFAYVDNHGVLIFGTLKPQFSFHYASQILSLEIGYIQT